VSIVFANFAQIKFIAMGHEDVDFESGTVPGLTFRSSYFRGNGPLEGASAGFHDFADFTI